MGQKSFCILLLAPLLLAIPRAHAQASWYARYNARAQATQINQPHWPTPLITNDAGIQKGIRTDFLRQTASTGQTTWNYGGSKGLQIIPFPRTEIRFSAPPFFTHSSPAVPDSFGDVAFRLKYRLYGSNEQHHNAIATFIMTATYPTGKHTNGSCCAVITPGLELGKGFGRFAATSALAGSLPISNTAGLGRQIILNNVGQFRITRLVWIEDEFNTTYYRGGKNDGKEQTFNTPGIILSRFPILPGHRGTQIPLRITLAFGDQIALTHFNTYNHSPVFSARLRF